MTQYTVEHAYLSARENEWQTAHDAGIVGETEMANAIHAGITANASCYAEMFGVDETELRKLITY